MAMLTIRLRFVATSTKDISTVLRPFLACNMRQMLRAVPKGGRDEKVDKGMGSGNRTYSFIKYKSCLTGMAITY